MHTKEIVKVENKNSLLTVSTLKLYNGRKYLFVPKMFLKFLLFIVLHISHLKN